MGFKLNHRGEILALNISSGNTNDRTPVPDLCRNLSGKLYANKGYIGNKLAEELKSSDVDLVTTVRKNMKKNNVSFR